MFWYILLNAIAVICTIIAIISFILCAFTGFECPEIFVVTLIAGAIAVCAVCGSEAIQEENTTTKIEVVEMEVTKCDITSVCSSNGGVQHNCYVTVNNKYIIKISSEEYAKLNVGDIVMVEITTKTVFGETKKPTIALKGDS